MSTAPTPTLPDDFFDQLDNIHMYNLKLRWYWTVIVNLAALNYPDVIPQVWDHCWKNLLEPVDHSARFHAAQKVREALIKGCGIMGPAKTGSAMRTLAKCIPPELHDPEVRRAKEDQTTASTRGYDLHRRIYSRNPSFDISATPSASPEYSFVVRDLLYGRVLSYPEILNDLETGHVVVAALIGLDCQYQLRNQMMGMMFNGATREEVIELRALCMDLAGRLGVRFRGSVVEVPSLDEARP